MPKLIVGNPDNESMVGDPERLTEPLRIESSIVAHRLIWLAHEGDAFLAPYPISAPFLRYVCELLGLDAEQVHVVVPPGGERDSILLTFGVLSDPRLLERLAAVMHEPSAWTALPYFFDRSVAWLSAHLGMADEPSMRNFMRLGGSDQLNSKAQFRRLAAGHDIPVAEGFICSSQSEFRTVIHDLIAITGAVIVKQDLHSGGEGNIAITTGAERNLTGAFETISINGAAEIDDLANQLWRRLTGKGNTDLVTEAYYQSAVPYYSELEIPDGGRRPYLLNFGEMRMDPIWVGFEIPGRRLTAFQLGDFLANSMKLADIARSLGYSGKINIDAIKTRDGRVLFTEVNGRLGGCTHIDVAAHRLLGPGYMNRYTVLSRNRIKTGSFERLLALLDAEGLLYTAERGRGAIILTEDTERTGTVEYMVVAPDSDEAYALEEQALTACQRSCQP